MHSGKGLRRVGDLALLLLAAGVLVLAAQSLRPVQPTTTTTVLTPQSAASPEPSTAAGPSPVAAVPGQPPTAAALGDGLLADDTGWYRTLVADLASPVRDVLNAGVPGETTAQIAVRVPDVVAASPQVVVVQAGTNDLLRAVPPETTAAELRGMLVALLDARVVPVLVTVPPSDPMADRAAGLNAEIAALGDQLGVLVLDPWTDVRQADGRWVTGTSEDGVEPTAETSRQAAVRARELLEAAELPAG